MSEVYIRTDIDSGIITFVHRRPFDPVNGLNTTRDELLKTGYFVKDYPQPEIKMGKRAIPYYDHERRQVYYEYQTIPFDDKTRIEMLEEVTNSLLLFLGQSLLLESHKSEEGDDEVLIMDGFAKYLANQIKENKIDRDIVIKSYPEMQKDIDKYLEEWDTIPVIKEDE